MSVSAEESAVKVCVRVRPLIEREERATAEDSVPAPLYWKADRKSIHQLDDGVTTRASAMIGCSAPVRPPTTSTMTVAKPLVVSAVEGYMEPSFAYGQTSSGRPVTMMGSRAGRRRHLPLSMEELFLHPSEREENHAASRERSDTEYITDTKSI
ncbi:unnamed protein product [Boreogadus saida]